MENKLDFQYIRQSTLMFLAVLPPVMKFCTSVSK